MRSCWRRVCWRRVGIVAWVALTVWLAVGPRERAAEAPRVWRGGHYPDGRPIGVYDVGDIAPPGHPGDCHAESDERKQLLDEHGQLSNRLDRALQNNQKLNERKTELETLLDTATSRREVAEN